MIVEPLTFTHPYAVLTRKGVPLGTQHETAESAHRWKIANGHPGARIADLRTGRTIRAADVERADAIDRLHKIITPGATVYTVLRHISRSGMMRHIDLYLIGRDSEPFYLTGYAAKALGWSRTDSGELKAEGCGMDIGFHAVYSLSRTLYPDGFDCISPAEPYGQTDANGHRVGPGCPSNDHSNREHNAHHSDGGYALRHRWL